MQVDTTLFQASNGRQPRGFGRWGFQVGEETVFVVGQYSDAKRKAFKVAEDHGATRVMVLPDKKLAPQGWHPERPEKLSQEQIINIKERLMAQAETRKFQKGKRERLTVPVQGMKAAEIMVIFDIQSKRTAHAIAKRGFHIIGYKERRQCPAAQVTPQFAAEAYRIANWWVYKKLAGRVTPGADTEDLIQEAVTRLIELAGDPRMQSPTFKFYVVRTTMAEYLRRNQKHQHEDEEKIEAPGSRGGTWCRANQATETVCRMIEARGITPLG